MEAYLRKFFLKGFLGKLYSKTLQPCPSCPAKNEPEAGY